MSLTEAQCASPPHLVIGLKIAALTTEDLSHGGKS
jgi:hypothetical protein